jgi:hypothetical protein
VVRLLLDNTTVDPDGWFYPASSNIDGLYVDDVSMAPTCFSATPEVLRPGDSGELSIGFEATYEPGSSLVLATEIAGMVP